MFSTPADDIFSYTLAVVKTMKLK